MSEFLSTESQGLVSMIQSVPRRLSRRALMKAAAIAPIIAAARQAWADPTTRNVLEFMRVAPMPADDVRYVRDNAGDVDPDKIEIVWRVLWAHFQLGLAGVQVQVAPDFSLVQTAYLEPIAENSDTTTGAKIAENVGLDKFDPLGNDYQTNVCAYICAHKAALLACATPEKKVTAEIYKSGAGADARGDVREAPVCAGVVQGKRNGVLRSGTRLRLLTLSHGDVSLPMVGADADRGAARDGGGL